MVLQVGDCLVLQAKGWEVLQVCLEGQVARQVARQEGLQPVVVLGLVYGL